MSDLREILQKKDSNYQVIPSDKVWGKIARSLNRRYKWLFVLLIVILFSTTTMIFPLLVNNETAKSEKAINRISNEQLVPESKLAENLAKKKEVSHLLTRDIVNTKINKEDAEFLTNKNQTKASLVKRSKPFLGKLDNSFGIKTTINDIQKPIISLKARTTKFVALPTLKTIKVLFPIDKSLVRLPFVNYDSANAFSSIISKSPLKPKKWSFSFYYSYQKTYRNFIKDEEKSSEVIASRDTSISAYPGTPSIKTTSIISRDEETPNWNSSFGVNATKKIGNWNLRMGASWSKYSYDILYVTELVFAESNSGFQYYSGSETNFISRGTVEQVFHNTIQYASLSTGLGFTFILGKHHTITPYTDVLFRKMVKSNFAAYDPVDKGFYALNNSGAGLRKNNIAFDIGFKYTVKLSAQHAVFIAPHYNKDFFSNSLSPLYKEQLKAVGVKVGYSIKLF